MPVDAPVITTRPGMAAHDTVAAMELEEAIRGRRTHKAYAAEPVDRETLDELLELARWAPNHHLTNPWRFRVLGPESLARLKDSAGPEAAAKLDRAPTLVCASVKLSGDPVQDEEDLCATACAVYIVLLAAHAPRAGRLLAHARRAAHARRRRGGGDGGGRAVRGAHPPGPRRAARRRRPSACPRPTS